MSKDSLVKGTLILALAALVARVLGVVQRIPLVYLIHDSGMATFTIAFNIYMPLLTIATAGIPSALSKLVSERMELGQYAEANRINKAAIRFALAAGWGHDWAVAGASFGGVMGSIGAILVLIWYYRAQQAKDAQEGIAEKARQGQAAAESICFWSIYRTIFRVSVPIVLFSLTVPLIYMIDSSTTIGLLKGHLGNDAAKDMLGILGGRAQSLAGIQIILAIAQPVHRAHRVFGLCAEGHGDGEVAGFQGAAVVGADRAADRPGNRYRSAAH